MINILCPAFRVNDVVIIDPELKTERIYSTTNKRVSVMACDLLQIKTIGNENGGGKYLEFFKLKGRYHADLFVLKNSA